MAVLDFKAGADALRAYFIVYVQMFPQIYLWCDTCWLYRGQHVSWAFVSFVLAEQESTSIDGGSNPWQSVPQQSAENHLATPTLFLLKVPFLCVYST